MPENDPFEPLDNFPEGLHVDALPASEVRRRGDRMRRRNTALAAVGGVVAAAVIIGTPVVVLAGNDDGKDDVQPAPSPSLTEDAQPGWLTEIPAEFPLADGFPEANGDGTATEIVSGIPAVSYLDVCGVTWPDGAPTDAASISYTGESEDLDDRVLLLLPDAIAAESAISSLREAIRACPNQPTEGGDAVIESTLLDVDLGTEDSAVVARQIRGDDGLLSQLTVHLVAQSGNAIFFEAAYGAAGGADIAAAEADRLKTKATTVLASMCVFTDEGCS